MQRIKCPNIQKDQQSFCNQDIACGNFFCPFGHSNDQERKEGTFECPKGESCRQLRCGWKHTGIMCRFGADCKVSSKDFVCTRDHPKKAEEPKAEEPKAEEPNAEEPKAEGKPLTVTEKQEIGMKLYRLISVAPFCPDGKAGKITGMILELEDEIIAALPDPKNYNQLCNLVIESIEVLKRDGML